MIFVATTIYLPHQKKRKGESLMVTAIASPATVTTWNIDPAHSSAEFKVKHMMISNVKGTFGGVKGVLTFDEKNPEQSDVSANVDVNTLLTCDEQRDVHLKSADFFDTATYPEMTFRSSTVKRSGDGEYKVTGDLTIHGVTKQVTFAVEGPTAPGKDPWGNTRIGISATTKINRKDYGLTWNSALETGGVLVGEEVTLTLEVQFIKAR
jgi:polyisoprenoid-binding protein YceI